MGKDKLLSLLGHEMWQLSKIRDETQLTLRNLNNIYTEVKNLLESQKDEMQNLEYEIVEIIRGN